MHKGHLLRFFSLVLFFISFCFFTTPTHAATDTPFSNFALTAGKSTSLGIPEGQDDLFYHNNIMFYAWCPNGSGNSFTCDSVSGNQITWIGDSYSEKIENENTVKEKFPGIYYNGQSGRMFANDSSRWGASGLNIIKKEIKNSLRDYLVFALGTNADAGSKDAMSSQIKDLVDTVKGYNSNTKIILVAPITNNDGARSTYDGYHEAMQEASETYDNILLADWYEAAKDHLNEYFDDHSTGAYTDNSTHPNDKGYEVWLQTIYSALPSDCGINIVSGGKTPEEKTWIGFRRLEYTPIQIAGIMGNIANEGGFNPISWQQGHESNWKPLRTLAENPSNETGMGIVGFTYYTHLANLASIMEAKAPDLITVLENPNKYYKPNGDYLSATQTMEELKKEFGDTRGEEIFDILLSIQILYIDYSVKDAAALEGIDWSAPIFHQHYIGYTEENLESPSAAALRWEWLYENHAGGTQSKRHTDAENFYNQFKDLEVSSLSGALSSSSSNPSASSLNSSSSSSNPTTNSDGTANYDSIMHAKNADKSFFNGQPPELSAAWDDNDTDSMKRLLENYGDLAYQLGRVVNIPYVAVLTQMRYEDSQSVCGKNNFWGNGCDSKHATTGGATIQGENLGEGFSQYAQTLTNGLYDSALGLQDPKQYLETIGPMWVQGSASGAGYGSIEAMKSSIDKLQAYIDSPEGQAIVKTFGNYHENSSSGADECGNGEEGTTNCTSSGVKIAEKAIELAWPNEQGQCETSTGTKIQYVGSANSDCDTTPKPAYKEAFQKYGMSGDMKDCGHFAATVIMASEVDPDFPKSGTSNMISYMEGNGNSKWERIQEAESDETQLKPGDLLINSTHVEIYVGDYGGNWGVIADASQGERVGEIGYYGKTVNGISNYKVFRIKGGDDCNLSGGLSEEQAQKLADNYNNNVGEWQGKVAQSGNYNQSDPSCPYCNCTLFSAFFVEMFTDVDFGNGWPNGVDVANTLGNSHNFSTGDNAEVYSIFSYNNHTGVVVKINDDGTVMTVEAAYGGWLDLPGDPGKARVFPNRTLPPSMYAYLRERVDESKLLDYINK